MITACRGGRNAVHACEDIRRVPGGLLLQLPCAAGGLTVPGKRAQNLI